MTYGFTSRARDRVGNAEAVRLRADAQTTVPFLITDLRPVSDTTNEQVEAVQVLLEWESATGKQYAVLSSTSLLAVPPFVTITNVPSTPPTNRLLHAIPGVGERWFRIETRP